MMGKLRRARTALRATAFALALMMMAALPLPSHAFLTELVVGGELALKAVSLMGQAWPQIMLVAANVLALVETGKQIAHTIEQIGHTLAPGHGSHNPPSGSQPGSPPSSSVPQIPTLALSGDVSKGSDTHPVDAESAVSPEVRDTVDRVVDTYKRKMDLYMKVQALPASGKHQLAQPLSALVDANEQAVLSATTLLTDAVHDNDKAFIDQFISQARTLDAASRPALLPVLNAALAKGRNFAALNGEALNGYPKLQALHDELIK